MRLAVRGRSGISVRIRIVILEIRIEKCHGEESGGPDGEEWRNQQVNSPVKASNITQEVEYRVHVATLIVVASIPLQDKGETELVDVRVFRLDNSVLLLLLDREEVFLANN